MPRIKLEKTIKNNLGQILKDKKMTAEDLAAKIHTTPATISRFKNLKTNLSMDSIIDITQVLGITIGELFGEIPVNYKDIINIRYIDNINNYSSCDNLETIGQLYGISANLLAEIGLNNSQKLIMTKILNNSMYDLISPTDDIIIDITDNTFNRDDIYLMEDQNRLDIRLLTLIKDDNKINVSMYNKRFTGNLSSNYERAEINKLICGRVVKILKNTN